MRSLRLLAPALAVLLASLLMASAATAQAGTTSASTVSVTVTAPSGPIAQGAAVSVPVKVHLHFYGAACSGASTPATVNLAVKDDNPLTGITITGPSSATVNVPGPQAYTTAQPFEGDSAPVMFNVTVAKGTIPNHTHSVNVTASFDASGLAGCTVVPDSPGGNFAAPPAKASLSFTTGAAASTNATSGPGSVSGSSTSAAKKSFTAPMSFEVAALLGVAVLVSRRQA